jgi:hypothetical protein
MSIFFPASSSSMVRICRRGWAVLESLDLGVGLRPIFFGEEDVVVGVGVERGIEVDQIDRFILDVSAEDVEVVPIV